MEDAPLLRTALRLNAALSLGAGIAAVAFATRVASLLRLPESAVWIVGGLLAIYGALLIALASQRRPASPSAVSATALDVLWVIGSIIFVAVHDVPATWLVLGTAGAVLVCALLQSAGLRGAMFTDGHGRFELEHEVAASAQRAWAVVSDVARYAEFAGTLHSSEIVSGEGVGLLRRCEDKNGVCWLETCTRWEPGRAYAFEVDTSARGYPLPLSTMRGDFEVQRVTDERSTIRIRFTFSARGALWTELLIAAIFATSGKKLVGAILRRWAERIEQPPAEILSLAR